MTETAERRRCARVPLDAEVAFRRPREGLYPIKIHDLTAEGCRMACPELLKSGDLVWVQLPSLETMAAWVRWTRKAHSGVEFDRPMHRAVFEMMAGRLAPTPA